MRLMLAVLGEHPCGLLLGSGVWAVGGFCAEKQAAVRGGERPACWCRSGSAAGCPNRAPHGNHFFFGCLPL